MEFSFTQDAVNPVCTCSLEAETKNHFILHCPYYENERHILFFSIPSVKSSILDQNDNNIVKTLLYGLDSRRLILDAVKKQDVRRLFQ